MKCPQCDAEMKLKKRTVVYEKKGRGEPQVWVWYRCPACGKNKSVREK